MSGNHSRNGVAIVAVALLTLLWAGAAAALTGAQKCEAAKLKIAGKYSFCRLKAESKGVKMATAPDYSQCDAKFSEKWFFTESHIGGACLTWGDGPVVQQQATTDADFIAAKLTGVRFVDNGDGTVTDVDTGLMWEQKDDLGGIHDEYNVYNWSVTGTAPDGTAFWAFLGTLNNGTSPDGTAISGCFAGHCDWRLPTSAELQTILLAPYPCGTAPCIDPIFGPAYGDYWSATPNAANANSAWSVYFVDGSMDASNKNSPLHARAVRGGL